MIRTPTEAAGRIAGELGTIEGRIGITVLLIGVLAVAGWIARSVGHRSAGMRYTRAVNAVVALGLTAVAAVVGVALLSLWEISIETVVDEPLVTATRGALTVVLALGAYLLTGVLKRVIHEFTEERHAISRHQGELFFRTTQVTVYALAAIVVFGVWDVNLGGLLVGAGFLGIVVGLAARQTLGSLIAGFVLMFSRPFEIGDWVEIGEREGIVTEISIVNTRIQTFDGEYAMIPNDVVGSNEIVNRTRKGRLRVHVDVGVDYATDVDRAMAVATTVMEDVDEALSVPQPRVVAKEFADSAVVLGLRFWIDKPSARRRWRARTAVIAGVKEAFEREGIKIPFPQRELTGRREEGGFRVADPDRSGVELASDGRSDDAG